MGPTVRLHALYHFSARAETQEGTRSRQSPSARRTNRLTHLSPPSHLVVHTHATHTLATYPNASLRPPSSPLPTQPTLLSGTQAPKIPRTCVSTYKSGRRYRQVAPTLPSLGRGVRDPPRRQRPRR